MQPVPPRHRSSANSASLRNAAEAVRLAKQSLAAFATEHADGLIAELQPSADAVDQRLLEVAREAQAALSERTGVYGRVNRILGYADGRNPAVEIPVWDTAPLQRAVETFGQALPPVVPQQPSKFSGRTVTPYDDPDPEIREQARTAA